jgi:hypothetical protein
MEKSFIHEDFHTRHRTPHYVADKDYKSYILGEQGRKRQRPIFTDTCFAHSCAGFSLVGVIFLLFVGILLDRQPLYIQGSLPIQLKQNDRGKYVIQYLIPTDERLDCAKTAYRTALAYLLTFALCQAYLHRDWIQSRIRRGEYQDIPDHASTLPSHQEGSTSTPVYQRNCILQMVDNLRQWIAIRGWFRGFPKIRRKTTPKTV